MITGEPGSPRVAAALQTLSTRLCCLLGLASARPRFSTSQRCLGLKSLEAPACLQSLSSLITAARSRYQSPGPMPWLQSAAGPSIAQRDEKTPTKALESLIVASRRGATWQSHLCAGVCSGFGVPDGTPAESF